MGDKSSIEWTDATWNPVIGCSHVSPGCDHCYAEALTRRYAKAWKVPGLPWTAENAAENVILKPERLDAPLKWKTPRTVFVNSMSDLFHPRVPTSYIDSVFETMATASQHVYQVLTKRPKRMRDYMLASGGPQLEPLPNVWLGTSIESREFVRRADALRDCPAAVRFISAEPLLGPLVCDRYAYEQTVLCEGQMVGLWDDGYMGPPLDLANIDWLIVGGESGPRHRQMDTQWARSLLNECRTSGHDTAFFMKQLGGARSGGSLDDFPEDLRIRELPTS